VHRALIGARPSSDVVADLHVPLRTCERVLDALRCYDETDAAIEGLIVEIERARALLLERLYGGAVSYGT